VVAAREICITGADSQHRAVAALGRSVFSVCLRNPPNGQQRGSVPLPSICRREPLGDKSEYELSGPPRWGSMVVVVAMAVAAIVALPSVWEPVLRAAGWALVVDEPVAPG
jgi:hypothetical protein